MSTEILQREGIYLWYYFSVQLEQIFVYWVLGMVIGSVISVFGKGYIHNLFYSLSNKRLGVFGIIPASILGIISPLCMYGTIPIAAAFSEKGMREDWLTPFMMSSILLNPQLIIYSAALGSTALMIRVITCFLCGITAGLLVHFFYNNNKFFNFSSFSEISNRDTDPNVFIRFLKNLGRNFNATGIYFLLGMFLSALFQRYVPTDAFVSLFGKDNYFGIFMAATLGVPLYVCGGGTIPLLQQWLYSGMSMGAAATFMITGSATKITNLMALKIVFGVKHFFMYLLFTVIFAFGTGVVVNLLI